MAIWLSGYTRHIFPSRQGVPYQYSGNPKLCWHTTEGGSVAGALSAYAPYPPHLIVNPKTGEKLQHISLDLAAYSAMDNNDVQRLIQLEVVGFAGSSHTWPDEVLRWLAENVVKPIRDAVGIPDRWLRFYGADEGITLASAYSPIRLTPVALAAFSGHVGHQHLSYPDTHWDPGRLPIQRILEFATPDTQTGDTENEGDNVIQVGASLVSAVQTIPVPVNRASALQIVPAGSAVWVEHLFNWGVNGGTSGDPNPRFGEPGVPALKVDEKRVRVFDIPKGTGKVDLVYSSASSFYVQVINRIE